MFVRLIALVALLTPMTVYAELMDVPLACGDLHQCRAPLGDWVMAGAVSLDPADDKRLVWTEGNQVAVNGAKGKTSNLHMVAEYGDVELHVEFMVPKGSNSGVYLMGRYEIQVLDSWGVTDLRYSDCGGVYQRHDEATDKGFEGHAPIINASKKPGEWQSFDITFRAPRFDSAGKKTRDAVFEKVLLNGVLVQEHVSVSGPTRSSTYKDEKPLGPLMFQGNHGPVAYRNVGVTALKTPPAAGAG